MEGSLLALLHEVAQMDPDYETEYAGRMETYCKFCDAYLTEGGPHSADCLHTRIKEALKL
jgi:hypothetical protein